MFACQKDFDLVDVKSVETIAINDRLTSTPARRKSAIFVKGTKYPMCAKGTPSDISCWDSET